MDTATTDGSEPDALDEHLAAAEPVVVRRSAGLSALVGAAASAIAIAYLWRATASAAPLDWALCAVLAGIAAVHLAQLVDARTPLLVADELGVRIRFGRQWRGLPWDAVDEVVVQPSRGLLRDGRLVFRPHSTARALEGLDTRGRRGAALNHKMYGGALAVPMGLTTRVSARGDALEADLAALAHGRADVVVVRPAAPVPADADDRDDVDDVDHVLPAAAAVLPAAVLVQDDDAPAEDSEDSGTPEGHRSRIGDLAARLHRGRGQLPARDAADDLTDDPAECPADQDLAEDAVAEDAVDGDLVDGPVADEPDPDVHAPAARSSSGASPLRFLDRRLTARADRGREESAATLGSAALLRQPGERDRDEELPESVQLRRPPGGDLEPLGQPLGQPVAQPVAQPGRTAPGDDRVRPIATLGDPVEPLVVGDFVTEPAYDPVIGPELAAARTRVGLSVDELAERTRIRPHVIESIEVDDFAPCGGDFYARGHLRTLARVLGRDPEPLLATFDRRYAAAPINARRVFEAELATGTTGSMRRTTSGGPHWLLLVGIVLALVVVWAVVRLFASEPTEVLQTPVPLSRTAGAAAVAPSAQAVAPTAAAGMPAPIKVALHGVTATGSSVVVRDRSGTILWAGTMTTGELKTLRDVTPPVTVRATDAGAIDVSVNGTDEGAVGQLGEAGRRSFVAPVSR